MRRAALAAALAVNAAVSAVVALPVLPVRVLAGTIIPDANQGTSDQIGWPVYVRQITEVVRALPVGDRARAVVITGNYGEAGALDRYGEGLPPVVSGQNELWYRSRPPDGATVAVVVGIGNPVLLGGAFRSCEVVRHLDNGVDVPNEEQDYDVRVCRDPTAPWAALWPSFQHHS